MREVYGSVRAYLARLPAGLDSYPQCLAKASVLRDALSSRPIRPAPGTLHPSVLELIEEPPPVNVWVSEVAFHCVTLAIYDDVFGGKDLDAFENWVCEFNQALIRRPLYRVLFALMSPSRLVQLAASRWSAFHRGSTISVLERDDAAARLRFEFPPRLYGPEMLRAVSASFRATAQVAGATRVIVRLGRDSDTFAEYSLTWDR